MSNLNGLAAIVTRKHDIAQAAPSRHTTIQRAAQALSRRSVDTAIVEVLNEALARLTALCYERDDNGVLVNVDAPTGRICVPLPWGRAGYAKWGLTFSEGEVMRRIMFTRQAQGLPLFFFERSRRAWYLNLKEYPSGKRVVAQLKEWEITVGEYRQARG
jgi:hypothetical protein